MQSPDHTTHIHAIRRFNRFYTRKIGVLEETMLQTPFTLTEARIIYEIGHDGPTTAKTLSQSLGMDGGYLSRTLRTLQEKGLVDKQASETDGRQYVLSLTPEGQSTYEQLDDTSAREIALMVNRLSEDQQQHLVTAMQSVESLLGAPPKPAVPYMLRPHEPGDLGWIVYRHGVLYTQSQGWQPEFEALCAEIACTFLRNFDPNCERCWIAEREGERVGSVCLVRYDDTTAQLRLLLVEPKARGLGIGKRLVQECTRFARQCGYERIILWTVNVLEAAHHIYRKEGYVITEEVPHTDFGTELVKQTWVLTL